MRMQFLSQENSVQTDRQQILVISISCDGTCNVQVLSSTALT